LKKFFEIKVKVVIQFVPLKKYSKLLFQELFLNKNLIKQLGVDVNVWQNISK
jgi:hypothetical protein